MHDTLAILGCGNMGTILAEGWVTRGQFEPDDIVVTNRRPERAAELRSRYGFKSADSNSEAADAADIVIVAVKPPDVPNLLREIARTITRRHLVISLAAGVTTASLEAGLPMAGPIVRAMPNVAARVGEAMTAIAGGDRTGEPDLEKAEALFASVGRVVRLPEHAFDAVTALSGSGPALFAFFAEAMIEAGCELGLSGEVAAHLVSQTMRGTAALLEQGEMSPPEVRRAVTSPGGTTEAALGRLEANSVAQTLREAVAAASQRARNLRQ